MNCIRFDYAEILRLHRCGLTARRIAILVGCCTRTVERVRRENGLTKPTAGGSVPQESLDFAAALFADGASRAEVARTVGISQHTIDKYFPGTAWSLSDAARWARMVHGFDKAIEKLALPKLEGTK